MLDFSICSVLYHHLHIFFSLHSHFWQTHTTHTYLHTHTTHHTCTHVHTNTPHARTQHVGTPTLTASHYWGILKVMIMSYMGFWAFQKLSKTSLNKITAGSSDSPMWYSGCLRGSLALSLGPLFCLCSGQLLCGAGAESVGIFALVRQSLPSGICRATLPPAADILKATEEKLRDTVGRLCSSKHETHCNSSTFIKINSNTFVNF